MSSGDGAAQVPPKVSQTEVKSTKYILQDRRLFVLLIHDGRQKVNKEQKEEKSAIRIDNDLIQLKEALKKFEPVNVTEIKIDDTTTTERFKGELKGVAEDICERTPTPGALLCVYLGFGGSEYVYLGHKEDKLEFADVVRQFNGENCSALRMKPKLFFVQAETTRPPKPKDSKFGGEDVSGVIIKIPKDADIFIYFSSALAGKIWNEVPAVSAADKNVMSRFVKLLCQQLKKINASTSRTEIQTLVINMNYEISNECFKTEDHPDGLQPSVDLLPLVTTQLTKELYLADLVPKSNP